MVEAEERRIKEREAVAREQLEKDAKVGKVRHKKREHREKKKAAKHDQDETTEQESSNQNRT